MKTTISIALANLDNWLVADHVNQEINAPYQQNERPPKIKWLMNALSTVSGIKSASIFDRSSWYNIGGWSVDDEVVNYKSHAWITDEQSSLLFAESFVEFAHQSNDTLTYKLQVCTPESAHSNERKFVKVLKATIVDYALNMHAFSTTFQNKTLHFLTAKMVFESTNITFAGDTTDTGVFSIHSKGGDLIVTKYILKGIAPKLEDFRGMTSYSNYLILWNSATFYWSDPNDTFEFTVGGASLAGSQSISEAKGAIVSVVPHPSGLMIYCTANIVFAAYSGDATNPWIFTEVTNSTGIRIQGYQPLVTSEETSQVQFAYTSKGIVSVSPQKADIIGGELTTLLTGTTTAIKPLDSSVITTKQLRSTVMTTPNKPDQVAKTSVLNHLEQVDDYLFLSTGHATRFDHDPSHPMAYDQEDYKLYIYEISTGMLSVMEGRVLGVSRSIREQVEGGHIGTPMSEDGYNYSNHYNITWDKRVNNSDTTVRSKYIGTVSMANRDFLPFTPHPRSIHTSRESELMIGDISLSPDRLTELLSVKLIGETSHVDLHGAIMPLTRAKVFAFSSIGGRDKAIEFKYYESVDKYLGMIVGDDIQVEVRGSDFYLTDIEFEIQAAGAGGI